MCYITGLAKLWPPVLLNAALLQMGFVMPALPPYVFYESTGKGGEAEQVKREMQEKMRTAKKKEQDEF